MNGGISEEDLKRIDLFKNVNLESIKGLLEDCPIQKFEPGAWTNLQRPIRGAVRRISCLPSTGQPLKSLQTTGITASTSAPDETP